MPALIRIPFVSNGMLVVPYSVPSCCSCVWSNNCDGSASGLMVIIGSCTSSTIPSPSTPACVCIWPCPCSYIVAPAPTAATASCSCWRVRAVCCGPVAAWARRICCSCGCSHVRYSYEEEGDVDGACTASGPVSAARPAAAAVF